MGCGSPKVEKASKMHLLSLLPLLCVVSAAPEGGLFGFGLLGGDSTTNTTTTTSPSTTPAAATTTALVEALTSTTAVSSSDTSGIIQNLVDVLTGKVATIALAAVTLNPPALALAMGGLAGNLVLTHIFTIATEALVSTTVAAAI